MGDIRKSCPSVRSSVRSFVRSFVRPFAPVLDRENEAQMEILKVNGPKSCSKMGPGGQKCHRDLESKSIIGWRLCS